MSIRTHGMNDTQRTFQFSFCGKTRTVEIVVGSIYEVQPLNIPKNKKNRGRICKVLGFRDWKSSCGKHTTERARVRWQDTERTGFVDPYDLIAKTS